MWGGPSDKAAREVVREQLQQEDGVIGAKVLAGDLSDSPSGLELTDRRFDFCAAVVFEGEVLGVPRPVVRDEGLDRVVEVGPKLDLLAVVTLAGAHRDDAKRVSELLPCLALEADLRHLG